MSMVMDHYNDKWGKGWPVPGRIEPFIPNSPIPPLTPKMPTKEELEEFYELMRKAKKYDEDNNQKDCEVDTKKQAIQEIADKWGIKIEFP